MKLILFIMMIAGTCFANDVFIGIDTDATDRDKNTLEAAIQAKVCPEFKKSQAVTWWKKSDHTKRYHVVNFNMANVRIKKVFTAAQMEAWVNSRPVGFWDNASDIVIVDKKPSNWERVRE